MILPLNTPCLLLDKPRLLQNISRMQDKARHLNVALRPHIKTAKSLEIADCFNKDICNGLTVSTLKEAEYFAAQGYDDIIYAVTIAPNKLSRAISLVGKSPNVKLMVDCVDVAKQLESVAAVNSVMVKVMIEIDVDGHRAGVLPESDELIEIAKALDESDMLEFVGILTHAGASYNAGSADEAKLYAQQEVSEINKAFEHLKKHDISCEIVSIGSTPTISVLENAPNVTEVRAGVFVFQDLVMANIGVCTLDDIAMGVLSTVISHKPSHNRVILDAGGLALSKDRGTALQKHDYHYGLLVDPDTYQPIEHLCINSANQEHGIVQLKNSEQFERLPIGSQVLVLPNHACMTAAAYDGYFVANDDLDETTASAENNYAYYTRINGW